MAITSTTINDLAAGTSTLTITSGTQIENIVYNNSSKTLVFSTENAFSLSASDFLLFQAILDAYNVNLLAAFNVPLIVPGAYSVNGFVDTDDGINSLTFTYTQTNHPLYSISGTYPNGTLSFSKRNQATTLTLEEWAQFLVISLHFKLTVKLDYNL